MTHPKVECARGPQVGHEPPVGHCSVPRFLCGKSRNFEGLVWPPSKAKPANARPKNCLLGHVSTSFSRSSLCFLRLQPAQARPGAILPIAPCSTGSTHDRHPPSPPVTCAWPHRPGSRPERIDRDVRGVKRIFQMQILQWPAWPAWPAWPTCAA